MISLGVVSFGMVSFGAVSIGSIIETQKPVNSQGPSLFILGNKTAVKTSGDWQPDRHLEEQGWGLIKTFDQQDTGNNKMADNDDGEIGRCIIDPVSAIIFVTNQAMRLNTEITTQQLSLAASTTSKTKSRIRVLVLFW